MALLQDNKKQLSQVVEIPNSGIKDTKIEEEGDEEGNAKED